MPPRKRAVAETPAPRHSKRLRTIAAPDVTDNMQADNDELAAGVEDLGSEDSAYTSEDEEPTEEDLNFIDDEGVEESEEDGDFDPGDAEVEEEAYDAAVAQPPTNAGSSSRQVQVLAFGPSMGRILIPPVAGPPVRVTNYPPPSVNFQAVLDRALAAEEEAAAAAQSNTAEKRPVGRPRADGSPARPRTQTVPNCVGRPRMRTVEDVYEGLAEPDLILDNDALVGIEPGPFSITFGRTGGDVDKTLYGPRVRDFQTKCTDKSHSGYERGGVTNNGHYQLATMMKCKTAHQAKRVFERAMGFLSPKTRPPNMVVCVKAASGKGLHTWKGLLGYTQKDRQEEHYEGFTHNVPEEEMEEGIQEYALWGTVQARRVELNMRNLMDRMEMHLTYRSKVPLEACRDVVVLLTDMLRMSQYMQSVLFAGSYGKLSVRALNAMLKCRMDPQDVTEEDVRCIFFNTGGEALNPACYFNTTNTLEAGDQLPEANERSLTQGQICDAAQRLLDTGFGGPKFRERLRNNMEVARALSEVDVPSAGGCAPSPSPVQEEEAQPETVEVSDDSEQGGEDEEHTAEIGGIVGNGEFTTVQVGESSAAAMQQLDTAVDAEEDPEVAEVVGLMKHASIPAGLRGLFP